MDRVWVRKEWREGMGRAARRHFSPVWEAVWRTSPAGINRFRKGVTI